MVKGDGQGGEVRERNLGLTVSGVNGAVGIGLVLRFGQYWSIQYQVVLNWLQYWSIQYQVVLPSGLKVSMVPV